jgi:hypothetical protein
VSFRIDSIKFPESLNCSVMIVRRKNKEEDANDDFIFFPPPKENSLCSGTAQTIKANATNSLCLLHRNLIGPAECSDGDNIVAIAIPVVYRSLSAYISPQFGHFNCSRYAGEVT